MAKSSGIGLDIGSSAVRAAEVAGHGGHEEIVKFAQVGLPAGAVVEGEIRDPTAVSAALKRLWTEGGFKRRDVILGVSSQRAMVRQIEVPQMSPNEMRSALRYQIGELLPIPVEQAVFDFAVLGPGPTGGDGGATTRLLVVAAQQDIVKEAIAVVKRAGLRVRAVDPSPLALLRAVPPSPGGGIEAVVSLGAHLVVVGVRQGTTPRFLRTVTSGNEASRDGAMETAGAVQAGDGRRALGGAGASRRLEPVVEEVRSSIEFFLGHNQGEVLGAGRRHRWCGANRGLGGQDPCRGERAGHFGRGGADSQGGSAPPERSAIERGVNQMDDGRRSRPMEDRARPGTFPAPRRDKATSSVPTGVGRLRRRGPGGRLGPGGRIVLRVQVGFERPEPR